MSSIPEGSDKATLRANEPNSGTGLAESVVKHARPAPVRYNIFFTAEEINVFLSIKPSKDQGHDSIF